MTNLTTASGTFEVKLSPRADSSAEPSVSCLLLDKQFHGDLDATSRGVMLAVGTSIPNSAGYVAMERVTGTLHGRAGSFALQHSGTMKRGEPQLIVTIVPDSGSGELEGISGSLKIDIRDGKHFYDLAYSF